MITRRITQFIIVFVLTMSIVGCKPPTPNPPKFGHYQLPSSNLDEISFDLTVEGINNFSARGCDLNSNFPSSVKVEKQTDESVTFTALADSGERISGTINGDGASGTYSYINCSGPVEQLQFGASAQSIDKADENGNWNAIWVNTKEIQRILTIIEANGFQQPDGWTCVECVEDRIESNAIGSTELTDYIEIAIDPNGKAEYRLQSYKSFPEVADFHIKALTDLLEKIYGIDIADWFHKNMSLPSATAKIGKYQVEIERSYLLTVTPQ
jgi:hypothetical protein